MERGVRDGIITGTVSDLSGGRQWWKGEETVKNEKKGGHKILGCQAWKKSEAINPDTYQSIQGHYGSVCGVTDGF